MLAAITLAALFGARPAVHGPCPNLPTDALVASARDCGVLEVTGRVDASSVSLDPAFDRHDAITAIARPSTGNATLAGYDRNGRQLFSFPFSADGPFRLVIGLGPAVAQAVARLTLSANGATFERSGVATQAPTAEALDTAPGSVTLIWNARVYPAIRIVDPRTNAEIATFQGQGTFEQVGVRTDAQRLLVSFSDGVQSFDRVVSVFAR